MVGRSLILLGNLKVDKTQKLTNLSGRSFFLLKRSFPPFLKTGGGSVWLNELDVGSDIASFQSSIWVLQWRQGSARGAGGRGEEQRCVAIKVKLWGGFFRLRGNSDAVAAMRVGIFSRPLCRLLSAAAAAYNWKRERERERC